MPYIPGIDGLRAFAVLGVLLYHLTAPYAGLGWSGVNLFFVISGFLITRILLETRDTENYFSSFYARRALRIFPIYYVTVLACIVVDALHSRPLNDVWYYFVYLQNHLLAATYFRPAAPAFLYHTWSLAVEEQFYLIWPFVVWLVPRHRLVHVCIALIVIAQASRVALFWTSENYYYPVVLLLPQADTLAAGALLACLHRGVSVGLYHRIVACAAAAGGAGLLTFITVLGYPALRGPETYLHTPAGGLLFTSLALLFFSVVGIVASHGDGSALAGSVTVRLLEWRVLRGIGRISYGVYMYHTLTISYGQTLINRALAGLGFMTLAEMSWPIRDGLMIALTVGIAWLSWRFFESRVTALKDHFRPREEHRSEATRVPVRTRVIEIAKD